MRRRRRARACSSWAETSGRVRSSVFRLSFFSPARRVSETAVAVAVRGLGSNRAISPKSSPGPRMARSDLAAVRGRAAQLHLAGDDEVELVTLVAFAEDGRAAGEVHLGQLVRQQTECVVVERGEKGCSAQYLDVHEIS